MRFAGDGNKVDVAASVAQQFADAIGLGGGECFCHGHRSGSTEDEQALVTAEFVVILLDEVVCERFRLGGVAFGLGIGKGIDLLGLSHEFFGRDCEHKSRNRVKDGYRLHEVAVGNIDFDLWK